MSAFQIGDRVRSRGSSQLGTVFAVPYEASSMLLGQRRLLPPGSGTGILTLRADGTALYEYWDRPAPLEVQVTPPEVRRG